MDKELQLLKSKYNCYCDDDDDDDSKQIKSLKANLQAKNIQEKNPRNRDSKLLSETNCVCDDTLSKEIDTLNRTIEEKCKELQNAKCECAYKCDCIEAVTKEIAALKEDIRQKSIQFTNKCDCEKISPAKNNSQLKNNSLAKNIQIHHQRDCAEIENKRDCDEVLSKEIADLNKAIEEKNKELKIIKCECAFKCSCIDAILKELSVLKEALKEKRTQLADKCDKVVTNNCSSLKENSFNLLFKCKDKPIKEKMSLKNTQLTNQHKDICDDATLKHNKDDSQGKNIQNNDIAELKKEEIELPTKSKCDCKGVLSKDIATLNKAIEEKNRELRNTKCECANKCDCIEIVSKEIAALKKAIQERTSQLSNNCECDQVLSKQGTSFTENLLIQTAKECDPDKFQANNFAALNEASVDKFNCSDFTLPYSKDSKKVDKREYDKGDSRTITPSSLEKNTKRNASDNFLLMEISALQNAVEGKKVQLNKAKCKCANKCNCLDVMSMEIIALSNAIEEKYTELECLNKHDYSEAVSNQICDEVLLSEIATLTETVQEKSAQLNNAKCACIGKCDCLEDLSREITILSEAIEEKYNQLSYLNKSDLQIIPKDANLKENLQSNYARTCDCVEVVTDEIAALNKSIQNKYMQLKNTTCVCSNECNCFQVLSNEITNLNKSIQDKKLQLNYAKKSDCSEFVPKSEKHTLSKYKGKCDCDKVVSRDVPALKKNIQEKNRQLKNALELFYTTVYRVYSINKGVKKALHEIKNITDINESECACRAFQKQIDCATNEKKCLTDQLETIQSERNCLEEKACSVKTELRELEKKFQEFVNMRDILKERNKKLNEEREEFRQKVLQLVCENRKNECEVDALRRENDQLCKAKECLKNRIRQLLCGHENQFSNKIDELERELDLSRENECKLLQIQDSYREKVAHLEYELCHRQPLVPVHVPVGAEPYLDKIKELEIELARCQLCYENQKDLQDDKYRNIIKNLEIQLSNCRQDVNDRHPQINADEVNILHSTIVEIRTNLERAMDIQEEKDRAYQEDINHLNQIICDLKERPSESTGDSKNDCRRKSKRPKVSFSKPECVSIQPDITQDQLKSIKNKEEIIKIQNDTYTIMKVELQAVKEKEEELRKEKDCRLKECEELRAKIQELECELQNSQERAQNLQLAVDLYLNSINVLEASEEKHKIEIEQQKMTISNLQEALVSSKHELESMKHKTEETIQEQKGVFSILYAFLVDAEEHKYQITKQNEEILLHHNHLQELNLELELEHCQALQDVEDFELQLYKYHNLLKIKEEENASCKTFIDNLTSQKDHYEKVVEYFKQEMQLMSEQLLTLQTVLTTSNESAELEANKLTQALNDVNETNQKLTCKLLAVEQQIKLENQMNQINEGKIQDLQKIVSSQDTCNSQYQEIIQGIKCNLKIMIDQNVELKSTIKDLNESILDLNSTARKTENENETCRVVTQNCSEQLHRCSQNLNELKEIIEDKDCELKKLQECFQQLYENHQLKLEELEKAQAEMWERQRNLKQVQDCFHKLYEKHQVCMEDLKIAHCQLQNKQEDFDKLQECFHELYEKHMIAIQHLEQHQHAKYQKVSVGTEYCEQRSNYYTSNEQEEFQNDRITAICSEKSQMNKSESTTQTCQQNNDKICETPCIQTRTLKETCANYFACIENIQADFKDNKPSQAINCSAKRQTTTKQFGSITSQTAQTSGTTGKPSVASGTCLPQEKCSNYFNCIGESQTEFKDIECDESQPKSVDYSAKLNTQRTDQRQVVFEDSETHEPKLNTPNSRSNQQGHRWDAESTTQTPPCQQNEDQICQKSTETCVSNKKCSNYYSCLQGETNAGLKPQTGQVNRLADNLKGKCSNYSSCIDQTQIDFNKMKPNVNSSDSRSKICRKYAESTNQQDKDTISDKPRTTIIKCVSKGTCSSYSCKEELKETKTNELNTPKNICQQAKIETQYSKEKCSNSTCIGQAKSESELNTTDCSIIPQISKRHNAVKIIDTPSASTGTSNSKEKCSNYSTCIENSQSESIPQTSTQSCLSQQNELKLAIEKKDRQLNRLQECMKTLYTELEIALRRKEQIQTCTCQQDMSELKQIIESKDSKIIILQECLSGVKRELESALKTQIIETCTCKENSAFFKEIDKTHSELNSLEDCLEVLPLDTAPKEGKVCVCQEKSYPVTETLNSNEPKPGIKQVNFENNSQSKEKLTCTCNENNKETDNRSSQVNSNSFNQTNTEMKEIIAVKEMEIKNLQKCLDKVNGKLIHAIDELEKVKCEMINKQSKIDDFQKESQVWLKKQDEIEEQQRVIKELQCKLDEVRAKEDLICSMQKIMGELKQKADVVKIKDDEITKLQATVKDLNAELKTYVECNSKMAIEISNSKVQMDDLVKKEQEMCRYRQIIKDLRSTMFQLDDLNRGIGLREMKKCENEQNSKELRPVIEMPCEDCDDPDIPCPCEVEFYRNVVETLGTHVIDLKKKLTECQIKYKALENCNKQKDCKIEDLKQSCMRKDKEMNDLKNKLTERIQKCQYEEEKFKEIQSKLESETTLLKQELEFKSVKLSEVKKSVKDINSSRCIQLACAQDEIILLKNELTRLLKKQNQLNAENEKLVNQTTCLSSTVTSLQERNDLLKNQLEQYIQEIAGVQQEKEELVRKNKELLCELRSLQSSYAQLTRQQRYTTDSVKNLEAEIEVLKNNRDEICYESKNIVNYVKAWLQEQRKINDLVNRKKKNNSESTEKLHEKECPSNIEKRSSAKNSDRTFTQIQRPPPPQSPWSLGSQGTASVYDDHIPSIECEWYSTNYQNDSEYESEEDSWAAKVENLAAQVRHSNNMWKNTMNSPCQCDKRVSRDVKK